ncbi:MAG TPA: hypothetical protein VL738_00545 [Dactylosporangium sp.]|nr:hypothetical protein [Dactylosporangium sp.]
MPAASRSNKSAKAGAATADSPASDQAASGTTTESGKAASSGKAAAPKAASSGKAAASKAAASGKAAAETAAAVTDAVSAEPDVVDNHAEGDAPLSPLEAIRRAQANRSLPPTAGGRGGRGMGKGGNPKAPRMYNRHK